jgi:hypothetical protein
MGISNEQSNSKYRDILLYSVISTIIYILYLEINPKITGIWLRKDYTDKLVFTPNNLKDFFLYPFRNKRMWLPNIWDMNPYISIPILTGSLLTIKNYFYR